MYHAVWFVNFTKRFDRREGAPDTRPYAVDDADLVLETIRKKDPEGAVATIAGYDGPEANLHGALAHGAAEDNSAAPIMVAHTVKTTRAAIVESEVLGSRDPLMAAGRFLASPKRERFVYNATLEAIEFAKGRARGEGK